MGVFLMNLFVHGGAQPSLIEHFLVFVGKLQSHFGS